MRKPELLAPAGDLERLKWAINYGADAVYFGGPAFGLRANAANFSMEDIKEASSFAHDRKKRIYVTVNISLHNKELDDLINYLKNLEKYGVDAVIVSDPAVINLVNKYTNLEIHLSTQQSTINYEAVNFWKKHNVTRIVLAREASGKEIKEIIAKTSIEVECFIHGAMCSAYSGRCVLSNFLTARDANRGGCAQICRWDFDLLDKNKNKLIGEKPFTLSSKDLSMLEYIPEMIDAGITSFKIEGRMRSIYYIATVLSVYRKVIDDFCTDSLNYAYDENLQKILDNCSNRDSIPQFFNGDFSEKCQYYNGREEVSNQDFLGVILSYDEKTKLAKVEQRNHFKKFDIVEIFGPLTGIKELVIKEIYDEDNNLIDIVNHPQQIVYIKMDEKVNVFDLMRIKK
ncbi:MAG: U32 family peptidase [Bacilli bacterium]|nr:U32 family peptidase [Bacilli bacterium]